MLAEDLKPNRIEAEILSGMSIFSKDDMKRAGDYFLNKGVKKVFISLGSDGVFYMTENESETIKIPRINPASSTGAGDAFVAGIAYGEYHDYSIREATKIGLGAGILTSLSDKTVSDQMNIKNVENIIKEMEI